MRGGSLGGEAIVTVVQALVHCLVLFPVGEKKEFVYGPSVRTICVYEKLR